MAARDRPLARASSRNPKASGRQTRASLGPGTPHALSLQPQHLLLADSEPLFPNQLPLGRVILLFLHFCWVFFF